VTLRARSDGSLADADWPRARDRAHHAPEPVLGAGYNVIAIPAAALGFLSPGSRARDGGEFGERGGEQPAG